jgi:hypothetical protein
MSNDQILNIGVPVAVGFILILAIGYGKSLHDDINTKPKRQLTSRVDISQARNNLKEIEEDLSVMTVQVEEGVKKIDNIINSLQNREIGKSKVSTVARGNKGKKKSKKKRK